VTHHDGTATVRTGLVVAQVGCQRQSQNAWKVGCKEEKEMRRLLGPARSLPGSAACGSAAACRRCKSGEGGGVPGAAEATPLYGGIICAVAGRNTVNSRSRLARVGKEVEAAKGTTLQVGGNTDQ
jgi:hypothetical protein